jgi:hypothetical protein
MRVTLFDSEAARRTVAGHVLHTPMLPAPKLSALTGACVLVTRLGELGTNILEVHHRRLFLDVPAKGAKLDITVETRDRAHAETVLRALEADGLQPARIEMATAME